MTLVALSVTNRRPKRLRMSVWGEEKVGKNHFGFTCPGPIYLLNFDHGLERALSALDDDKVLMHADYGWGNPSPTPSDAEEMLNEFTADYAQIIKDHMDGSQGTIIWDTGTFLWQVVQVFIVAPIRESREASGKSLMRFDYGGANSYFQNLINMVKPAPRLNLVLLHRAKERYNSQGQRTGVMEAQQQASVPYAVDLTVKLWTEIPEGEHDHRYYGAVQSCGYKTVSGINIVGEPFENMTYGTIAALLGVD